MNEQERKEKLDDIAVTVKGLRREVEGWRIHMGSASEFVLIEIDRLIGVLNELKQGVP